MNLCGEIIYSDYCGGEKKQKTPNNKRNINSEKNRAQDSTIGNLNDSLGK